MFGILRRSFLKTGLISFKFANFNSACTSNMTKTALLVLANGAEEMEAVIAVDVLRRGGVNVTVAGIAGEIIIKCSRDVQIKPDATLEAVKCNQYDAVVLPGGLAGSQALCESKLVGEILQKQLAEGRIIAAICAAPTALLAHSIENGKGKSLTSYPAFKSKLENDYKYIEHENVVQDGNLITSRGPGTAFEFALKLVEVLVSCDKRNEVAKGMLL